MIACNKRRITVDNYTAMLALKIVTLFNRTKHHSYLLKGGVFKMFFLKAYNCDDIILTHPFPRNISGIYSVIANNPLVIPFLHGTSLSPKKRL